MNPKVSINLCCYNSEKYLRETLDSIVNQTYKDWELIIINDGSSDSTESIIYGYINQGFPIIYHSQENKGLGYSRNEALKRSQGEYIAFIDHDDIWMPKKLEKQIPLFNDPEVGLVFSDAIYFNEKGQSKRAYEGKQYWTGWCFSSLLSQYFLVMQTVVIRRITLHTLKEMFDPRFTIIEEADLFRRIGFSWKLAMVNEPLAKWRVHATSISWTQPHLLSEETPLMLAKYDRIFPEFRKKYAEEIKTLERQIDLDTAWILLMTNKGSEARRCLSPYKFSSSKVFILSLLSHFPKFILSFLCKFRGHIKPV